MERAGLLEKAAPIVFVLLWSTGWLVATYAAPYSDPLTFLFIRFVLSALVFVAITIAFREKWPAGKIAVHAILSGIFLHTIYLGGVWWAIDRGVPTSVSGLLAALQPLLTAMIAYWTVGERLNKAQKAGLALGFLGLLIAIGPSLAQLDPVQLAAALVPLSVNAIAMLAVTIGTIYQKKTFHDVALLPVATLQYVGAAIFVIPAIFVLEPQMHFEITFESIVAMVWSIFGLSLGAIMLLLMLIKRGQVSRAASLIYLIPPTVAVEAWLIFGEKLSTPLIVGTIIVVAGVWLVNRKSTSSA
ncbi:MAG: DMT family transporter [Pseudomonadota bacterium]